MASKEAKQDVSEKTEESKAEETVATASDKDEIKEGTPKSETPSKEEADKPKPDVASSEPPAAAAASEPPVAAAAADEAEVEEKGKRVYIGNLAWQVSWQDLKDHLKSTGLDVTRANVMTGPDGRSKGCGIAEFATAADAAKAVATFNDTELKGRQIFVREDREDKPITGFGGGASTSSGAGGGPGTGAAGHRFSSGEDAKSRRVYVGNLSWDVAWQDLKDYMKQAGEVLHAEVISDPHSGRSKGCGIVEYSTEEEAQEAIDTLSNTELNGRAIFVREDRETTSKSGGGGGTGFSGGGGSGGGSRGSGPRNHDNPSVYVWNLAPETSWQDLKDHMRKAGNVDSATVFTSPSGDTSSGIVVYQRAQDAVRAVRELQGTELHGVAMSLREDRMHSHSGRGGAGRGAGGRGRGGGGGRGRGFGGRGGGGGDRPEPGSQIFVGNLAYTTTWQDLKDHFRQCGEVKRTEVKMTNQGQSKGFGVVQFAKKEDAEAAIERLNGSELQGRELEVRLDQKSH